MKSFAKVSVLFALIILGRYLQPVLPTPLANRPALPTQVLPVVLARYTSVPQLQFTKLVQPQPATGYFL